MGRKRSRSIDWHTRLLKLPKAGYFWIAIALLVSAGCSSSEYPLAPVSGVVTLDGEPLEGARLSFQPRAPQGGHKAGPPSYGDTDSSGSFELVTFDGDAGAVVATHRVSIRTEQAKPNPDGSDNFIVLAEERLPARYHRRSKMSYTVAQPGTDECNFELTTKDQ